MDQWLRALTDLLEDMGSILSTHTMAHNGLQLQLQGFSGLRGYQAYSWHKDIYEYKTPTFGVFMYNQVHKQKLQTIKVKELYYVYSYDRDIAHMNSQQ